MSAPSAPTPSTIPNLDYLVTKIGTVPKLTHDNFPAWSKAIKFVLIGIDVWDIVDSTEVEPAVNGNNQRNRDEIKDYRKRSNKAMALIHASVSSPIQSYIAGLTNPMEMWKTLQQRMDIVQNESGSNLMREIFYQETYKPTDTMDLYISRILSYQERLANTKLQLTDDDIMTKMLSALPSTHQTVKEIIFNQPNRTITSVITSLRQHVEITHAKTIAPEATTTATAPPEPTLGATNTRGLYHSSNRRPPNRRSYQRQQDEEPQDDRGLCWYCGRPGHREDQCFIKERARSLRQRHQDRQRDHWQRYGNPDVGPDNHEYQIHFGRAL